MKKIVSNLSVMIFVIGCAIMEITTWFIDSYVMFYIGIIIVIVGIIGMIIQGKFKKVIEFIIEYQYSDKCIDIILGRDLWISSKNADILENGELGSNI